MKKHARAIARASLWLSASFNLGLTASAVYRQQYALAATQSILVALLAAWLYSAPKFDAWLDARLTEAIAQRDTANIVFDEVQRMQRAGELRLGVTAAMPASARTH